MPAIILRKMGPINAFNLLKDTKAVRVGIVYRYLILRHKDFVNMIVLFYVYTQNVSWLLRNINPVSRVWYEAPLCHSCSSVPNLVKYTGLEKGIIIPFLFPKH